MWLETNILNTFQNIPAVTLFSLPYMWLLQCNLWVSEFSVLKTSSVSVLWNNRAMTDRPMGRSLELGGATAHTWKRVLAWLIVTGTSWLLRVCKHTHRGEEGCVSSEWGRTGARGLNFTGRAFSSTSCATFK